MGAAEIAFAIPINEVKNFLDTHGLDHVMPVRRLRLGVFQAIESKGLGLRLPEGFADRSWFMSHVETGAEAGEVAFRLDRAMSPWTPRRVEEALVSGKTFEPLSMSPRTGRDAWGSPVPSLLLGGAAGTEPNPAGTSGWTMRCWSWDPRSSSRVMSGRPSTWRTTKACCASRSSAFRASASRRQYCRPLRRCPGPPWPIPTVAACRCRWLGGGAGKTIAVSRPAGAPHGGQRISRP